jgi:hexosaminidase
MSRYGWIMIVVLAVFPLYGPAQARGFFSELKNRGYSLIPAPQKVELQKTDIELDGSWEVVSRVGIDHIAAGRLRRGAAELHGLMFRASGGGRIVLEVATGTVTEAHDPALAEQAYRLEITPDLVKVTGNTDMGLYYGVQSLLQLMRKGGDGKLRLPAGTITDWPTLQLRFVHWNMQCHQNRLEALKHLLEWAAFFKINCIGFEIMDRYEFPRHPIIGAPGAFTKAQMHELTAYALEHFIQLVPVVQAPAHMHYVLKHEEFAHLRSDGSNYQACMCDEEAMELIFDMYQDMIDATPGVKYFFVSTDEVYYAGICDKCVKPYNVENRSQIWVDYVNRVHAWMAERGRRMLAWVEYPLLTKDILQLPGSLIDAIMGPGRSKEWIENQKKIGMRSLAYSSMQGTEFLFPNYFPTLYRGRPTEGRLESAALTATASMDKGAALIGSFAAAWDNSGLHEECFWLGWATVTQYSWTPRQPTLDQNVADFMDVFYGPGNPHMVEIYRLLEDGARFFEDGWDRVPSRERGRGYGNSKGKGIGGQRVDLTLSPPSLPAPGNLALEPTFSTGYKDLLEKARLQKRLNEHLRALLAQYISQVKRNRYNLEVYQSIAFMQYYFIKTLLDLESVEASLLEAAKAAAGDDPAAAADQLVLADRKVGELLEWRDWLWREFKGVWEKSRFPKNRSVGGRDYVYVLDDVKDYFADRRLGLEYQLAPFERMDLPGWRKELRARLKAYATENKIPLEKLVEDQGED